MVAHDQQGVRMLADSFAASKLPSCLVYGTGESFDKVWSNALWDQMPRELLEAALACLQSLSSDHPSLVTLSGSLAGYTVSLQRLGDARHILAQIWSRAVPLQPSPFERRLAELGSSSRRTLEYAWQNTALGPISTWPASLQAATYTTLTSKHPSALWIGNEQEPLVLHNDVFGEQLAMMDVFGDAAKSGFGHQYPRLLEFYSEVKRSKRAIAGKDSAWTFPDKDGRDKETLWDYEWLPLYHDDGRWLGCFNTAIENSDKVHAQRDLETLAAVTNLTASARTVEAFCASFADTLCESTQYFPFMLLYASDMAEVAASKHTAITGTPQSRCLTLRGSYGVNENHTLAPPLIQINAPSDDLSMQSDPVTMLSDHIVDAAELPWRIQEVMKSGTLTIVDDIENLISQLTPTNKTKSAVVFPLQVHDQAMEGVLILGLFELRPFTDGYANLATLLSQCVNVGLNRVVAIEVAEAQTARLLELDRLRSIFFQTINEELQTPLSLILAPLSTLVDAPDVSAGHKKSIRTASRNALHLMHLFGTLLDFFRLQSGTWTPTFQHLDLQPLLTDIVHHLLASSRSADAPLLHAETKPAATYIDPHVFEKLVLLLVGVLLRSRRRHQYEITLVLRPTESGACLQVVRRSRGLLAETSDTRNGADHLSVSGELGETDDNVSSFDRLGLAQSLLEEFVQLLRGSFQRKEGIHELIYEVHLPTGDRSALQGVHVLDTVEQIGRPLQPRFVYAAAVLPDDMNASDEASEASTGDASSTRFTAIDAVFGEGILSIRDASVCLADGHAEMRTFCRDALAYFPNVSQVANAQEALDSIAGEPSTDLLIIDTALPGMDAWSLIAAMRENGSDIPVIVLSTRSGGEARADSLLLGAAELLVKPFSARELLIKACSQLQIAKIRKDLQNRLTAQKVRTDDLDAELRAFTNTSPVGLFTLNENGDLLYTNSRWNEITGIAPADRDSNWLDNIADGDRVEVQQSIGRSVSTASSCEVQGRWNNGKDTMVSLQCWRAADGSLRFAGSVVDVTELRRLESAQLVAIQERANDAERMRQLQETSVDIFSHELRNPLSAISQAAQLLGDELEQIASDADQSITADLIPADAYNQLIRRLVVCDETLSAIKACSLHQRRITDDILNFSKLNMRLLSLSLQPFDIVSMVQGTIKMFEPEVRRHRMRIEITEEPSLSLQAGRYVIADPHRLNQVLINFLTNAIRYGMDAKHRVIAVTLSAYGGVPALVPGDVRVSPDEGLPQTIDNAVWLRVAVRDHGRGLSRYEQDALFERFAQARPTIDGIAGTGLGLWISRAIVHLHGGFVEISSSQAQSTTFSLCIPAQRSTATEASTLPSFGLTIKATALSKRRRLSGESSAAPPNSNDADPLEVVSPAADYIVHRRLGGKDTVLVVDDSSINVKLLTRQLQKRHFNVMTGSNGQEALSLIAVLRPRLLGVCLDVEMPVMDGMTAVAELRRQEKAASLPRLFVLAVTGNAREAQRDACLSAGYDSVLTKVRRSAVKVLETGVILEQPYSIDQVQELIETANREATAFATP